MRILLTVIFLQVLHVDGVEADRVLGVVDVLAEGGESVRLIQEALLTSGVDDVLCVTAVPVVALSAS